MPISPHVAMLRSLVGRRLLHLPSVAVLCRDEADRVLLVLERDSEKWCPPGGVVEPGEAPAETARREALEETGLSVLIEGVRAVYRKTYANGDELSYVCTVYDGRVVGEGREPEPDETIEVRWASIAELASLPKEPFLELLIRDRVLK